jgi:type II secretory ATPase GspE/PulE/Tfp pilus assembly ATPase PilB-like protein
MIRNLTLFAAGLLFLAAGGELAAQDAWPASTVPFARGPGFYAAIWKLVLLVLVIWAWVKSADWVSRDTAEFGDAIGLPASIWNPVVTLPFLFGFLLAITIPVFLAGWAVALVTWAMPFVIYVVQRNGRVTDDKKVFTPAHLQNVLANLGKKQPKQREVKHAWQLGPEVDLTAVGPLQMENQQALIEARSSPAFVSLKYLLADALTQRADRIMLEYAATDVAVKYQIDGVWHNAAPKLDNKQPLDRSLGDAVLVALKRLCHLKPQERRARQEGHLRVAFQGNKYDTTLQSQGTQAGERVVLAFAVVTKQGRTLEELGMRDKVREQLDALIGPGHHGLVVFAALPGDGLSASWQAALRGTDRLMRDFISVEPVNRREPDVENVDVQKIDTAKGESVDRALDALIRKQPEVICIPEIPSGAALGKLAQWIKDEDKLGIVSTRAKDAPDTLLRLLALKPPVEVVAEMLRGVVYIRLVRRLCDVCREAYQPTPDLLQKLGIPAGRVHHLYREKQPRQPGQEKKRGEPDICPNCRGLGYKGRIAFYEILTLDDKLRQAVLKQANIETIKKLAKAAGNRTLQEEGILLVALGTTSLTELQRVLKQ